MIEIYTDGCAIPNPGAGGWAFVVYRDDVEIHEEHGGLDESTNNAMELSGMLNAPRWLRANRVAGVIPTIHCDSQYVVKGCTIWRTGSQRNAWKTKAKKPVANKEAWETIAALLDQQPKLSVRIQWVKGHAGVVGNERADELTMVGAAEASGQTLDELQGEEDRLREFYRGGR